MFEHLIRVNQPKGSSIERQVNAIEGNEFAILANTRQNFRADVDIYANPTRRGQDTAKKIDTVASSTAQIKNVRRPESF